MNQQDNQDYIEIKAHKALLIRDLLKVKILLTQTQQLILISPQQENHKSNNNMDLEIIQALSLKSIKKHLLKGSIPKINSKEVPQTFLKRTKI